MTDTEVRSIEYLPLDDLRENPKNPKGHADIDIDASMDRFGYTEPVLLDERTGLLVAGHGRRARLIAMRDRGDPPPAGVSVTDDGVWTVPVVRGWASVDDDEASAYLIASNRLVEKGGWEEQSLTDLLEELTAGPGLSGIGFTPMDLDTMLADLDAGSLDDDHGERGDPDERGKLLNITDVSYGEPNHEVHKGEVWRLGHHTLAVTHLLRDHVSWKPLLQDDMLFIPYPSPYLLLSRKADETPCLAIQPDVYLAGHVLDKYASIHGEDAIELLRAAPQ